MLICNEFFLNELMKYTFNFLKERILIDITYINKNSFEVLNPECIKGSWNHNV